MQFFMYHFYKEGKFVSSGKVTFQYTHALKTQVNRKPPLTTPSFLPWLEPNKLLESHQEEERPGSSFPFRLGQGMGIFSYLLMKPKEKST